MQSSALLQVVHAERRKPCTLHWDPRTSGQKALTRSRHNTEQPVPAHRELGQCEGLLAVGFGSGALDPSLGSRT